MKFSLPTISKQNRSSGTSEIDFCLHRCRRFRDFWAFFLNCGQWVNFDMISKTYFSFQRR